MRSLKDSGSCVPGTTQLQHTCAFTPVLSLFHRTDRFPFRPRLRNRHGNIEMLCGHCGGLTLELAEMIERTFRDVHLLAYLTQEELAVSDKGEFFDRATEDARTTHIKALVPNKFGVTIVNLSLIFDRERASRFGSRRYRPFNQKQFGELIAR